MNKKLWMICGILLCVGIGCIGVGKLLGGEFTAISFSSDGIHQEKLSDIFLEEMTSTSTSQGSKSKTVTMDDGLEAFEGLDVSMDVGHVKVAYGETYELTIYTNREDQITYEVNNGVLRVEGEEDGSQGKVGIDIVIPEGTVLTSCKIYSDVGDVTLTNIQTGKTGEIGCDVGKIELTGCTGDYLTIVNNTGNVDLEEGEYISLNATNDIGSIKISQSKISQVTCKGEIGAIEVGLVGNGDDYNYNCTTEMGNININGQSYHNSVEISKNNKNSLDLENEMGDIKVEIK